jgi:hypothetical protein
MKTLLIAGALAFALFSAPVVAQECDTIESVSQMALGYGGSAEVIPGDLLDQFAKAVGGSVPDGAKRGLFISGDGGAAYGFEMEDGCLTPPTFIKPGIRS